MLTSTSEAATILGTSRRQVQYAVQNGLLGAQRIGNTLAVYEREVFALRRMKLTGRRWNDATLVAVLDLLSGIPVAAVQGSQLSRLKARVRVISDAELAGAALAGNVTLYRASSEQLRTMQSTLSGQTALAGDGTAVLVGRDLAATARRLRLVGDPEGNVIAVNGNARHTAVLEALSYTVYGSARERSAGRAWLEAQRTALLG